MGKISQAWEDLNLAIEKEPMLLDAYWHRHLLYLLKGKSIKALEDLNIILRINKDHVGAYKSRWAGLLWCWMLMLKQWKVEGRGENGLGVKGGWEGEGLRCGDPVDKGSGIGRNEVLQLWGQDLSLGWVRVRRSLVQTFFMVFLSELTLWIK